MRPLLADVLGAMQVLQPALEVLVSRQHMGNALRLRLALHCVLQLLQAPARIVFYIRVRATRHIFKIDFTWLRRSNA